jgi:hypothetical protein
MLGGGEFTVSDRLWNQVGVCFDTDDGSLPGIEVSRLSPDEVAAIYAMLRSRSHVEGDPPEFWSTVEEASLPVDSVPNAAALVASGHAEAFHMLAGGIVANGVLLPPLGVFVWPDTIELDYRMGSDWGPVQVAGLFELLRDCCRLASGAVVVPAEFEGPPYPDRFLLAWSSFGGGGTGGQ